LKSEEVQAIQKVKTLLDIDVRSVVQKQKRGDYG